MVKIYDKLKNIEVVEDFKDFMDLIHIRAIRINDFPLDDPRYELQENDKIQVGIRVLEN